MNGGAPIVVGVDGSSVALHAVTFAAREAALRGARLLIVHAAERGVEAEAIRDAAEAAVHAAAPGVDIEFVGSADDPARTLIACSDGAALVVVGTFRAGEQRGFVLGSVSQQVAAHAQCPVATVGGAAPQDGPLVVGASGSDGGMAALRFACTEARRRGVPVKVIRAVTVEDLTAIEYGYPVAVSADAVESAERVQMSRVLKVAREEFPDLVISGELTIVDAFTALEQATEGASLLVLGSQRERDAERPHLGPVTAWLLHQAHCPLVVVPAFTPDRAGRDLLATA